MRMYRDTDEGLKEAALMEAKEYAYNEVCSPYMSRKERRTAKGRMMVAQAEAAALKVEVEFLRKEIKDYVY